MRDGSMRQYTRDLWHVESVDGGALHCNILPEEHGL